MGEKPRWWEERIGDQALSVEDLRNYCIQEAEFHWSSTESLDERLRQYVDHLLPYELEYAARKGAIEPLRCHTLVLLAGYSMEPLFQAIGVYEPVRIVLLLNQTYGCRGLKDWESGEQYGRRVKDWIENLLTPALGDRRPKFVETHSIEAPTDAEAGQPDAIFRTLCEYVLEIRRHLQGMAEEEKTWDVDVLVDITGAKKSMDVGAFLFAAYAGIDVTYVDFDCYVPDKRRPYGFSCRIGQLRNPYETFVLREWEAVQHAYERYHFRSARETVQDILPAMKGSPTSYRAALFAPDQIAATERLCQVLRFYEAWDDGNYSLAHELRITLQPPYLAGELNTPTAVDALATFWADLGNMSDRNQIQASLEQRTNIDATFLLTNSLLLTYARDEWAKIDRLVKQNEDHRSALLRAVGLEELLLKARWVRLWKKGLVYLSNTGQYCHQLDDATQNALFKELVNHSGDTGYWRQTLQLAPNERECRGSPHVFLRRWDGGYQLRSTKNAPRLQCYENGNRYGPEILTGLRNQATHKYQSITQSVAQAAVDLARANLEDFEDERQGWIGLGQGEKPAPPMVERVPWNDVRALCRLEFLPTFPEAQKTSGKVQNLPASKGGCV